jgi:hypothetical protein
MAVCELAAARLAVQLAAISAERIAHMQRTIGANAHRLHAAATDFVQARRAEHTSAW